MQEIKIERNVPKPIVGLHTSKSKKASGPYSVLARLKDGESVLIFPEQGIQATAKEASAKISTFKSNAKWTAEQRKNREFTLAEEEKDGIKGVRIWLDYIEPEEKKN